MTRLISYILVALMVIPLVIIPIPGVTQSSNGVYVAAKVNAHSPAYVTGNILITDQGTLWIVINKSYLTWLGDRIRISLINDSDTGNPNSGGFFFRLSNVGDYGPSDPTTSPYGGVINITKSGPLYNEYGDIVGNVTFNKTLQMSVIKINMKYIDLSDAIYIKNVYLETYISGVNLYGQKLAIKVFKESSWDAVVSDNRLKVVKIPVSCKDVVIDVIGAVPTPDGWDVYRGDWVTVIVSYAKYFEKVKSLTGVDLSVTNSSIVEMVNYYDLAERYILANYTNNTLTNRTAPAFLQDPAYLHISNNGTTIFFQGVIWDYAPSVAAPNRTALSAYYKFLTSFHYSIINDTTNLTFAISCSSESASTTVVGKPFLYVVTAMTLYWNGTLHPGSRVKFQTHNVPANYNRSNVDHLWMFIIGSYVSVNISASSMLTLTYNREGEINGTFIVPDAPYGGHVILTALYMNDGKYVDGPEIRIYPYIETYIVTNDTLYAIDNGSYYTALFTESDFAAPGDYLYVKGYGFDTTNSTVMSTEFQAYLNNTQLWRSALIYSNTTGKVDAVFRVMDTFGDPAPVGNYTLLVGVLASNNNWSIPFEVVRNETVSKIMVNPELAFDTGLLSFVIKHDKFGGIYGNFTVEYPLVNGTFQHAQWVLPTILEFIGLTVDQVNVSAFSQTWNISYPFILVNLTEGYAAISLYYRDIGFLPYGNYTLLFNGDEIRSIDNRTIFNVKMGVSVESSGCRNGTLTVTIVGGAPNTNMTLGFSYTVEELINSISPGIPPVWAGELHINVSTNIYGVGTNTVPLRTVYPDEYLVNATLDTLIRLGIRLERIVNVGNETLVFLYYAALDSIDDNLGTGIDYQLGPSTTSFSFETFVFVSYNYTLHINTSTLLYRYYFVISVPDTVLPGDNITVQIFPHRTAVWDMIVLPETLFDATSSDISKVVWKMDVRLVEPYTNTIVRELDGWYVGNLIYEDVDNDGLYEYWFVVNLKAPFILGEDKLYRVDVKLEFAVATSNTTVIHTNLVTNDNGCHNNITVNGSIIFEGYGTSLMLGGVNQRVEVLGVLEGKLDWIKNGVAEINATVNDISSYIKVNVTELLKAINNTVVEIKNDTATLLIGQAELKAELDDLLGLVADINRTVTIILNCCGSLSNRLDRMEATLNDTERYVLEIKGNVSEIASLIHNDVLPKFAELYHNITVQVNASRDAILFEIRSANATLANYILMTSNETKELHDYIVNVLTPTIGEYYRNITLLIENTNATLSEYINASAYSIMLTIGIESDLIANAIHTALDTILENMRYYYGNLSLNINQTRMNIMGQIDNSTMIILMDIDEKYMVLNDTIADLFNKTFNMIRNVNASIVAKIDESKIELETMLENVNSTLSVTIVTEANKTRELTKSLVENLNSTILSRLDEMEGTLTIYMTAYEQRLEGLIEEKADDIVYNISVLIDNDYNALKNLINVRADQVVFEIRNATSVLVAEIGNVNLTLYNKLNEVEAKIDGSTAEIKTALGSINTTLKNFYESLENLVKNKATEVKNELYEVNESLATLTLRINDTLTMTISGKAAEIASLINTLSNTLSKDVDKIINNIGTIGSSINSTLSSALSNAVDTLSSKIDGQTSTLKDSITTSSKGISDKIDALGKTVKDTSDKINSNVSIFGAATLLLVVIVIGLVGYSLISGRRLG